MQNSSLCITNTYLLTDNTCPIIENSPLNNILGETLDTIILYGLPLNLLFIPRAKLFFPARANEPSDLQYLLTSSLDLVARNVINYGTQNFLSDLPASILAAASGTLVKHSFKLYDHYIQAGRTREASVELGVKIFASFVGTFLYEFTSKIKFCGKFTDMPLCEPIRYSTIEAIESLLSCYFGKCESKSEEAVTWFFTSLSLSLSSFLDSILQQPESAVIEFAVIESAVIESADIESADIDVGPQQELCSADLNSTLE